MKIKNLNIKNKAAVLTAGGIILGQGAFSAAFFANDRYPFVKNDYTVHLVQVQETTKDGDFTYHGHFNPYGYMSRDCTLYQEEDGTAYFISASRDNADLHVYRLSDDYMNVDCLVHRLWQGEYREAPAVIKGKYHYYMISSFCTGWAPNQGKYAWADSIEGRWSSLKEIGDETTYDSQSAFLLNVNGKLLYVGDRWGGDGDKYFESGYVVYPLKETEDGLEMIYQDTAEFE